MSLLPRRLRAGHAGHVAVHPGWTLSPPTAESTATDPLDAAPADLPASRWTSSPALPPLPAPTAVGPSPDSPPAPSAAPPLAAPLPVPAPVPASLSSPAPLGFWVDAPAASIATVLAAPLPLPVAEEPPPGLEPPTAATQLPAILAAPAVVDPPEPSWTSEWEAVAATPTTPSAPLALHTAAAAALEAAFGRTQPGASFDLPAVPPSLAPAPVVVERQVADRQVAEPFAQSVLDRPLPANIVGDETPLATQAVAFLQASAAPPAVLPVPAAARTIAVPAPAQQLVERAVRSAPSAPAQRRSTVRLGFTDASVIDLRPDDPMAKALHTVAHALMDRDGH